MRHQQLAGAREDLRSSAALKQRLPDQLAQT